MEGQIRIITDWMIVAITDSKGTYNKLIGFTVGGNQEKPMTPGCNSRLTETSPIKEVVGRSVITESGTTYVLGTPSVRHITNLETAGFKYDDENPINKELLVA